MDMFQQPIVNSFFFLLTFGSMSVYLTGIAYKMVQNPKEMLNLEQKHFGRNRATYIGVDRCSAMDT